MAQLHILVGASAGWTDHPSIRRIRLADLIDALAKGLEDFSAMRSHAVFLCLVQPVMGILLVGLTLGFAILSILYPLAAGFALIGPFAAVGLYELSRRREAGVTVSTMEALDVLDVLRSPSIGAIVALGVLLGLIFVIWIATANAIYVANFGHAPPQSISQFVHDVLFTPAGWNLIIVGNGAGFLFAVAVLMISVVSFPLLLDRDVGAVVAVVTSVRAVLANPITMAMWGLIVVALLVVGSLPLYLGLPVVLPVLGHSTWHLYRKVVEAEPSPRAKTSVVAKSLAETAPGNFTIDFGPQHPSAHELR